MVHEQKLNQYDKEEQTLYVAVNTKSVGHGKAKMRIKNQRGATLLLSKRKERAMTNQRLNALGVISMATFILSNEHI